MLSLEPYILPPGTPCFTVNCNGNSVTANTDAVRWQNGIVMITGEAAYRFTGELAGMIVIDAGKEDTVNLILDGVKIINHGSILLGSQ